jgi:hypothetical protein
LRPDLWHDTNARTSAPIATESIVGTPVRSSISRGAATPITASINTGDEVDVRAPRSVSTCSPSRVPGCVTTRNGSTSIAVHSITVAARDANIFARARIQSLPSRLRRGFICLVRPVVINSACSFVVFQPAPLFPSKHVRIGVRSVNVMGTGSFTGRALPCLTWFDMVRSFAAVFWAFAVRWSGRVTQIFAAVESNVSGENV